LYELQRAAALPELAGTPSCARWFAKDNVLLSHLFSGGFMNGLRIAGIVLVLLGVLSFVVPLPHREDHSVKIGDAKIGVTTENNEKVPMAVSVVLLVGGVLVLALGSRKA
jgi:hypothetical protein